MVLVYNNNRHLILLATTQLGWLPYFVENPPINYVITHSCLSYIAYRFFLISFQVVVSLCCT